MMRACPLFYACSQKALRGFVAVFGLGLQHRAVDRLALKGLGAYQLYIGAECRYFNTAASHELMLPLGHCPNRHFLKYAALILIFHSIAQ